MSTFHHSMARSSPQGTSYHHPQPTGVGRPVKGNIKHLGQLMFFAMLFMGFQAYERLPENFLATVLDVSASSTLSSPIPLSTPEIVAPVSVGSQPLYLLDKASLHITDTEAFEAKVRDIAGMLQVAPEWLMAVIYSESKFDASVRNFKGSGATGLIQFMAGTAEELNVSLDHLANMNPVHQLEYVYLYLDTVRKRYGGYSSLTDLYLAVLYPKARGEEYCYTMYARPTQQYNQNSGLDENKDGRVTVSDIERRMKRLYPTAYMAEPIV